MPPIAADALLASANERPAAPSASTTLLRRFRGAARFVCDITLPFNTSALNGGAVLCLARTLGKCQKRQKSSADEQVFVSVRFDTNFLTFEHHVPLPFPLESGRSIAHLEWLPVWQKGLDTMNFEQITGSPDPAFHYVRGPTGTAEPTRLNIPGKVVAGPTNQIQEVSSEPATKEPKSDAND